MRGDVLLVPDLAAEDLVALPAVVGLLPTLQVHLAVVALEGRLVLEEDVALLAPELLAAAAAGVGGGIAGVGAAPAALLLALALLDILVDLQNKPMLMFC